MKKVIELACDFETINNPVDCRVWSWGIYKVGGRDGEYRDGTDLKSFFDELYNYKCRNLKLIFHNARFDFSFLEYYLVKNLKLEWVEKKPCNGQYTSLISREGVFYSAKICVDDFTITVVDSTKIIKNKLANLPKMLGFDFEIKKGEIDYNAYRPIGYIPSKDEKEYQFNDCKILALAWEKLKERGYNKLTLSSNVLEFYKRDLGRKTFKALFPVLDSDIDYFLRDAYAGGICVVNPRFQNKKIGKGRVYDVNSLYPWAQSSQPLPYGKPVFFEGQYKESLFYPLYVSRIRVDCKLKDGHIPCIILKGGGRYTKNTYLIDTNGEMLEKTLTCIDIEILKENYDIYKIEYIDGYMFHTSENMFTKFFSKLFEEKQKATETGDIANRTFAKLEMNGLGGKFGTNSNATRKKPVYSSHDGIIHYEYIEETKDTIYLPVIMFVTAYGRKKLMQAINDNLDRFLYCDTDSIHLLGDYDAVNIEVDKIKIGAWDYELKFIEAKYIRQKTYIEIEKKELADEVEVISHVKAAGLVGASDIKGIGIDSFKIGMKHKCLKQKRVANGVILQDTVIELK